MNNDEKMVINANDILDEWEFSDKALINRSKTEYRFDFDYTVGWGAKIRSS